MRKKWISLYALLLLIFNVSLETMAQESKFKALFISKFAEYIEWPSGSKNVTVGIVDDSDIFNLNNESNKDLLTPKF